MRPPPGDHWSDALPDVDRVLYRAAWNEFRSCRDCHHWAGDDDGIGACGKITMAAYMTPEDYTCDEFEPKK